MSTAATTSNAQSKPTMQMTSLIPLALVGIVLLMVIPLPPFMLDLLLASSIALSVSLLLIALNLEKPLDLSAFPTILLFATLLRLSLNVASTRLILLDGHQGPGAAGNIIRAFGEFMIGGNFVVGAAVFILLVIINFVVITKGAGRVAEVSARFTLDALPGKQMSIDADLSAGAMTQDEARTRRKEVEQESDFFGAMDGASKFVRGDAIAGLLMTGFNITVGFIVGVMQNDMSAGDAAGTYTLLTVGDGLVSQIPALLVSTAAGVVVTRASAGVGFAPTLIKQIGGQSHALYLAAFLLVVIGFLPGMPALPFWGLAVLLFAGARSVQSGTTEDGEVTDAATDEAPTERTELEDMLPLDMLELEVGLELVPLVDAAKGGELVTRITQIRKNLASEIGVIIPSIHIRDNLRLNPFEYRMLLSGNEVGKGELRPGKFLAMDPTGSLQPVDGEEVREPAFGLPARWVVPTLRERAETLGYTVVDESTVAATHLTEMLRSITPEILGRPEAQELFDIFARSNPRLVDDLIPNLLSMGEVIRVMRNLLEEGVSVRDLRTILEGLADAAPETKDADVLTERVRQRLARHITARFRGQDDRVAALMLDPRVEDVFRGGGPDANEAQRILSSLDNGARAFGTVATPPAVICAPDVRRNVAQFLTRRIPGLSVISYREVDSRTTVRTLGVVSL